MFCFQLSMMKYGSNIKPLFQHFWTPEEIDFSKDRTDWLKLSDDEDILLKIFLLLLVLMELLWRTWSKDFLASSNMKLVSFILTRCLLRRYIVRHIL